MDVRGWIGGGKRVGLPLPVVKAPGLTAEDPFCFQPSPSWSWSDLLTNIESSAQPESSLNKISWWHNEHSRKYYEIVKACSNLNYIYT